MQFAKILCGAGDGAAFAVERKDQVGARRVLVDIVAERRSVVLRLVPMLNHLCRSECVWMSECVCVCARVVLMQRSQRSQ